MPSSEMQSIIELLRSAPTKEGEADLEMLRSGYELLVSGYKIGPDIDVREINEPFKFKVVKIKEITPKAVMLYLHGGGYCIGSTTTHAELCSRIARETQFEVYILDYPLAPEHPFPAAFNYAIDAYNYLATREKDIVVAGDSAGGGLALAVIQHVISSKSQRPLAGVLFSPWTDLALTGETLVTRDEQDPLVSKASLAQMANWYLNGHDPKDPKASPLYGRFEEIVPLLIQVGSLEVLFSDSERVMKKAQQYCDDVIMEEYEGAIHVFQQIAANSPEAKTAIESVARFLTQV